MSVALETEVVGAATYDCVRVDGTEVTDADADTQLRTPRGG
ncbi:MAG: hypothetical protein OXJ53_03405 [Gammaproteobacteria bacterium]|nr:hypothetical protein [Gammaproteobacteria bacterium]